MPLLIPIVTALSLLLVVALATIRRVPMGQVHSLYRYGKPSRLLQPGVHVVMPMFERIAHRIDLNGQVLRFQESVSDDVRDVCGTVYWQVLEPERADAVIDQADQIIRQGACTVLRENATAANDDRLRLGNKVKQTLNNSLRARGMMVTRVELEVA